VVDRAFIVHIAPHFAGVGFGLTNHGGAEKQYDTDRDTPRIYFLAPCSVRKAGRDAGFQPFKYTSNDPAIQHLVSNFVHTFPDYGFTFK
jgi:hypothetical protein